MRPVTGRLRWSGGCARRRARAGPRTPPTAMRPRCASRSLRCSPSSGCAILQVRAPTFSLFCC